jgi:tetratricopeptide (TPR) repeat protein
LIFTSLSTVEDRVETFLLMFKVQMSLDELWGYQAWKAGDSRRAAELWAGFNASRWRGILRGDVYWELGRLQKAEDWYIGVWKHPVAHERLGQLYEEVGRHGAARAAYERFVAVWKNADPKLQARVTMAQKRLDALGEQKTAE